MLRVGLWQQVCKKASLSVYQWGQMSGFAVEEQAQPHLINNIIVLLRTAMMTDRIPQIFLSSLLFFLSLSIFSFILFSGSGSLLSCGMAEPEWHCHHPLKQNMSQKPERWDQNHYCILPGWKRRSVLGLKCKGIRPYFQMHYIICFVIFEQLWSRCYKSLEQIFSMSATSETPVGEIYLHLSFKKRHESINHESHGRVCVFICV